MRLVTATRSEITKLTTTSGWWVLLIVLVAYVGGTAAAIAFVFGATSSGLLTGGSGASPDAGALPPILYSLATAVGYVIPLLLGSLMTASEFRHKTLTPTFLATPRRGAVLWAKVVVGTLVGAVFGVVGLAASIGPSAAILAGFGLPTALEDPATWALAGRTVIAFALWVLVGVGLGALVRSQVAAIVIALAFTQLIEPIARMAGVFVSGLSDLTRFLPGAASDALVGQSIFSVVSAAATDTAGLEWWQGGLVLLGYAFAFLLLGHIVSWRRDVS